MDVIAESFGSNSFSESKTVLNNKELVEARQEEDLEAYRVLANDAGWQVSDVLDYPDVPVSSSSVQKDLRRGM